MAQLMVHRDVFRNFSQLPKNVQNRVSDLIEEFHDRSKDPSLRIHPLPGTMLDSKVRGADVKNGYRAIIIAPEKGDTFLLVHVDKHDAAYNWAKDKRFEVHGMTGVFQVFDMKEAKAALAEVQPPKKKTENKYPLSSLNDDELYQAGTPRELIPAVRAVQSDDGFEALAEYLPPDCRDTLRFIAAGMSLNEALHETLFAKPATDKPPASPGDFTNIANAPSYDLVIVSEDVSWKDILNASLEEWRVFLHPYQRKLVDWKTNGPMAINGAAGTGKTVVLMHRAVRLAKELTDPKAQILVTTFTTTLSLDIKRNIRKLAPDHVDRIEVTNLHALARTICSRSGWKGRPAEGEDMKAAWESAWQKAGESAPLSQDEMKKEYRQIIEANGIDNEDAYLSAIRTARPMLKRNQRKQAWAVFVELRRILHERQLLTPEGVVHQARLAVEQGAFTRYAHVLIDETQDFGLEALRLIKALSPAGENEKDPLCLVGDGHQRIYVSKFPLSRAGIAVVGRSRRLKINYRTSEQIRAWALGILVGADVDDLNGGTASVTGDKSVFKGPPPQLEYCRDAKHEAAVIVDWIKSLIKDRHLQTHTICIAPYKKEVRAALQAADIPTYEITSQVEDPGDNEPGIRMGTIKRIKGLEFRAVAMACSDPDDALNRKDAELSERCERYVAATRAREHLLVCLAKK